MKKAVVLSVASLSLVLLAPSSFSQQQPHPPQHQNRPADVSKDVPAELQEARQKLESAKADLSKAGGEWGGFRSKAIQNIDEALSNLNRALEYRQRELQQKK